MILGNSETKWLLWLVDLKHIDWVLCISSAIMGLFKISRGLKFKLCNHGEPCARTHTSGEEAVIYGREREDRRVIVINESMALHWLSPCQKRRVFPLPVGLNCHGRAWKLPLWPSNFILTSCLLIFIKSNITKVSFLLIYTIENIFEISWGLHYYTKYN